MMVWFVRNSNIDGSYNYAEVVSLTKSSTYVYVKKTTVSDVKNTKLNNLDENLENFEWHHCKFYLSFII